MRKYRDTGRGDPKQRGDNAHGGAALEAIDKNGEAAGLTAHPEERLL